MFQSKKYQGHRISSPMTHLSNGAKRRLLTAEVGALLERLSFPLRHYSEIHGVIVVIG